MKRLRSRTRHRASRGGYRLIPLTQGLFALVDAEDYERLSRHKWHVTGGRAGYYAARKVNGRTMTMHREILNVPAGMVADHKNHNTLDNRKCNLRICTPAQNAQNKRPREGGTSRYKGVSWHKDKSKWRAVICHRGRTIHIGYYDYQADAAIAYDDRAIELFGEFACLNTQYRPEIKEWLQQTFFFPPTRNDLARFEPVILNGAKRSEESGPGRVGLFPSQARCFASRLSRRPELAEGMTAEIGHSDI